MGAVKTNHKRNAQKRWVDREIKKWDRDCQDEEQQYNRGMRKRHDAHKLKRLYPNSIAPERVKVKYRRSPIVGFVTEYANGPKITMNIDGMTVQDSKGNVVWVSENLIETGVDVAVRNGRACIDGLRKGLQDSHACADDVIRRANPYLVGIDLASGKDQTGYGGRIE